MKGKLIKLNRGYYNLEDEKGNVIGTSYQFKSSVGDAIKYKLSKQNCDEIFGVYSPSELSKVLTEGERGAFEFDYCIEREHNKDKLFTIEDMLKAYEKGASFGTTNLGNTYYFDELIHSMKQPMEIEVEIVTESMNLDEIRLQSKGFLNANTNKPKLDSNGCLILKKI